MANIYRDVTLQNVSENDIGKQMKVSGWVRDGPSRWSFIHRFKRYVRSITGSYP